MNAADAQKYLLNITTFSQKRSVLEWELYHLRAHSQIVSESQLKIWHFPASLKESDEATEKQQ